MNIIIAILILGFLIFFHELGHYSVAKFCGIKVNEFSIGFGPKLFGFTKGETLYAIRAIPMGGFVKMEGEDKESDDERAFSNKPTWQKFLVVVAGAFMNLLLGFILMLILVLNTSKITDMIIEKFADGAVSSSYGLKEGDKILKIDKYSLKTISDLNYILIEVSDRGVNVIVERNNEKITLENVHFSVIEDKESGIKIANIDFKFGQKDITFLNALRYSFDSVISDIKSVWITLAGLIKGKYSLKVMSGPIQITETMATMSSQGFIPLMRFVILITVNWGVINLFPLPALDGGRILFLLIEMIRRKPLKQEWEGYIHLIGFALLILLSIYVIYNDILRIIQRYIN